jgi:uncharacterized protein DUF5658
MEPPLDQRRLADRRARPTTLWSTLCWKGRRTGFRRTREGHQAYVDGLSWRIAVLTVFVSVCSILDALLTLLYLQDGGGEANPLMALALAHSNALFLAVKLSITGAGVWVLAAESRRARPGVWGSARRSSRALLVASQRTETS